MSDLGRGMGGTAEEDRLPWLEPVEDETREEGVSAVRLFAGLLVALIALGLVVGGVYWLKQRVSGPPAAPADPTLIAAQPGDYKTKPAEPGGMDVKGRGDSSYAASEGADPNAKIDLSAAPEAPVSSAKPELPTAPAAAPAKAPAPAKPVAVAKAPPPVAKPAPAPAAAAPAPAATVTGGGQIQLGAFASEAKANQAWAALSGRFGYLSSLSKSVQATTVGGKTVYRLRASAGGQGSSLCSKLKVAGEACMVVG